MADPPKEIDLGGDVYICVGLEDDKIRIKVSSAIPSAVSPYFRALFGPRFKEGTEAAQGKDIDIEEDDPEAFAMLCEVLHMRFDLPETPLGADDLLAFAIASDKYSCTKAVALAVKSIFPDSPAPSASFNEVGKLASAAYLLDHPQLFQRLTEYMAVQFSDDFLDLTSLPWGQHVPAVT